MVRASIKLFSIAAAVTIVAASAVSASPIRIGFDSGTLGQTDDGSSASQALGFTANFFGTSYDDLYVNNNGNVTFDAPLRQFTPDALSTLNTAIIAPFFADVDTANGIGNAVTFGQGTVDGQAAFGVNWVGVNYYNNFNHQNQLNSFQLVLIDRGNGDFDIEFNYWRMRWESGMASGGDEYGLGGDAARVGFSAGSGNPFESHEIAGSGVSGALIDSGEHSLWKNSNINVRGRYVFSVTNGANIAVPEVVPVPAGLPLVLTGLIAFACIRRRQTA